MLQYRKQHMQDFAAHVCLVQRRFFNQHTLAYTGGELLSHSAGLPSEKWQELLQIFRDACQEPGLAPRCAAAETGKKQQRDSRQELRCGEGGDSLWRATGGAPAGTRHFFPCKVRDIRKFLRSKFQEPHKKERCMMITSTSLTSVRAGPEDHHIHICGTNKLFHLETSTRI